MRTINIYIDYEILQSYDVAEYWLRRWEYVFDRERVPIESPSDWVRLIEEGFGEILSELYIKSGIDEYRPNLFGANLAGFNLKGAELVGADMRGADLRGANLTDANLTNANLKGADLRNANLTGAVLVGANLKNTWRDGADMTDAVLTYAMMD